MSHIPPPPPPPSRRPMLTIVPPPDRGPGQAQTSADAYEHAQTRMPAARDRILDYLRTCGANGATCDEVEAVTGIIHQTASPIMLQLRRENAIWHYGKMRATRSGEQAEVYALTPPPPPPKTIRVAPPPGNFVMSPQISLDPEEITGMSMAIMGTNKSGKSGTARQLMEQHIAKGLDKYPFTVFDIENEYATLKELGEILIVGVSNNYGDMELDLQITNSGEFFELGRKAFLESLSIVLLLDGLDDEHRKEYLTAYLHGLFEAANDPRKAHYYRIFLEECQEYIPQFGRAAKDELRKIIVRIAKRGRKRKLSLCLISQRPSNVDKDVLTQVHILFLCFVTYSTDINIYASDQGFGISDAAERVKKMQPGDVIFMHGKIQLFDRINLPKTFSPWDKNHQFNPANFKKVEGTTVLQETIIREGSTSDEGSSVVPTAYIHGLEKKIPQLETEITTLGETLGYLQQQLANRPVEFVPTGNNDLDAALAENQALRRRLDIAQAENMVVNLFVDIVKNRT